MKNVFIDSDVILDVLTAREPHAATSIQLFRLIEIGKIHGFVSPIIFSNIHYILRRSHSKTEVISKLRKLKSIIKVSSVNDKIIDLALSSNFNDFEDAIQYYTAIENNMDCLITRNKRDYKNSNIPIYNPEEYLKILKPNSKKN